MLDAITDGTIVITKSEESYFTSDAGKDRPYEEITGSNPDKLFREDEDTDISDFVYSGDEQGE